MIEDLKDNIKIICDNEEMISFNVSYMNFKYLDKCNKAMIISDKAKELNDMKLAYKLVHGKKHYLDKMIDDIQKALK